jgi:hypothetical protein
MNWEVRDGVRSEAAQAALCPAIPKRSRTAIVNVDSHRGGSTGHFAKNEPHAPPSSPHGCSFPRDCRQWCRNPVRANPWLSRSSSCNQTQTHLRQAPERLHALQALRPRAGDRKWLRRDRVHPTARRPMSRQRHNGNQSRPEVGVGRHKMTPLHPIASFHSASISAHPQEFCTDCDRAGDGAKRHCSSASNHFS